MSDQSNQDRGNLTKQETPQPQPNAGPNPLPIPPELESTLRSFGVDFRDPNARKVLAAVSLTMVGASLPFVPPQILEQYKNVDPRLVDKLVEWTDAQSAHRRTLEDRSASRSEDRFDRGQWIAAAVALGGLFLSAAVGIFGNPWVAGIIALVCIGGPTAAIIFAQHMGVQQHRQIAPPPPRQPSAAQPAKQG